MKELLQFIIENNVDFNTLLIFVAVVCSGILFTLTRNIITIRNQKEQIKIKKEENHEDNENKLQEKLISDSDNYKKYLETRLDSLDKEVKKLNELLVKSNEENKLLQQRIFELEKEQAILKERGSQMMSEINHKNNEINEKTRELDSLRKAISLIDKEAYYKFLTNGEKKQDEPSTDS